MSIPDNLLTLFTAEIDRQQDEYTITLPEREISVGELTEGERVRVGVFPSATDSDGNGKGSPAQESSGPPVEEGDRIGVEIVDRGEQGDGIARINGGYVVFVEGADVGDRVAVEITSAQENFAFADVLQGRD